MNISEKIEPRQILLIIGFIIIGIIGRYALVSYGAPPNFEIIMILTFVAAILTRPSLAILVPLGAMIGSDIALGNPIFVGAQANRIVLFTYSGFALLSLFTMFQRTRLKRHLSTIQLKSVGMAAGLGIGFVLLYDLWTNLGWWYLMYPHTLETLGAVYLAGIPFMINHLISGAATFVVIGLPLIVYSSQLQLTTIPISTRHIYKLPVAALTVLLVLLSFTGTSAVVPDQSDIWLEHSQEMSVTLIIQGDDWTIKDNLVAYEDDTVFDLLQRSSQRLDFDIEYTYYEDFDSILIDSIHGTENGANGKYWQYYINDQIPMVGADAYIVSNGDIVEWRFEIIPY